MAELFSREFYKQTYVDKIFDYNEASDYQLSIPRLSYRPKLHNKIEDSIGVVWDAREGEDIYRYSQVCWNPPEGVDSISMYPWRGRRQPEAVSLRYFWAGYNLEGAGGLGCWKRLHLCGNPRCCNPSHIMLVPKGSKSGLLSCTEDIVDVYRALITRILETDKSDLIPPQKILAEMENIILELGVPVKELQTQKGIQGIFAKYHVEESMEKLLKPVIRRAMRGNYYAHRAQAQSEMLEKVLLALGYGTQRQTVDEILEEVRQANRQNKDISAANQYSEEEVNEINNWTTNTDHHELTLNELHKHDEETKPVDEIEAILEDTEVKIDIPENTEIDEFDDNDPKAMYELLISTGMSEEEAYKAAYSEGLLDKEEEINEESK
jgi:hypothetical protein